MTTWAEFLEELRADLQDTSDSPRWTDDMLYTYFKDAMRDYSQYFPRRIDAVQLNPVGSGYGLPTNFVDEIYVECPAGTFLERREEAPGRKFGTPSPPLYYYLQGGNLYLMGTPFDATVLLTYFAAHQYPSAVDDENFVLDIPDIDIELPRIYIKAQVHSQMRQKQSRLDRFEPGSGRRDDNPLTPEYEQLMAEYHRKIAERIRGGSVKLYRAGATR